MDLDTLDDTQIEKEARKQGWKPEEEWKGNPPARGFVTAKEFLTAAENSLPLATKQLHEREEELDEVKNELRKLKAQTARFADMTNKKMAADRDRIQGLIQEQKKLRAQAISEADGDAVLETEERISELEKEAASLGTSDPGIEEWRDENDWYQKDQTLRALADGISMQMMQENPNLTGRAHLDELAKRVKDAMPDKFENPKRKNAPPVGSGSRTPASNGRGFEDLPEDAKRAYGEFKDMFKSMGKDYSKADYLASYEWED
jgi:hypothetical protein